MSRSRRIAGLDAVMKERSEGLSIAIVADVGREGMIIASVTVKMHINTTYTVA